MAHESPDVLKMRLAAAEDLVALGSLWRHYNGSTYRVIGHAIDEASDQAGIAYAPADDPELKFFRLLSLWQEPVELNGQTIPRFVPTEE
jgi:hypothetical protein